MDNSNFNEKRLFERISCSVTGDYTSSYGAAGTFVCKDISPRGAGIIVPDSLGIGTHMNMQITTKKQTNLSLDGKVRWSKKLGQTYRIGIEFDQPLFTPLNVII